MADCLEAAIDELATTHAGRVQSRSDFEALVTRVRDGLAESLERIGEESAHVLAELQQLEMAADDLPERHGAVWEDVASQVGQFIYPGFITGVGSGRLNDLARYLAAATYRLRRIGDNPDRDHELMVRVNLLEEELDRLVATLPWSPELVDVWWMLQELRVSLFAQWIGARGPISEKRVRRALEALVMPS
jgi:ATP-dependent helicase HrpA